MRYSIKSKFFLIVAAAMFIAPASPALAQQYRGSVNSRIGTIGDTNVDRMAHRVNRTYGLNLRPMGLFGDAEVFSFGSFRPFIFPLPDFGSRNDYVDVSFEEYLDQVASSYRLSINDYLFQFQFQNAFTAEFPDFIPTFQDVLDVHRRDFATGGGFLPFGQPTIPNKPQDKPGEFEPLPNDGTIGPDGKPFEPLPIPGAGSAGGSNTTTLTESNLANEIVGGGTLNVDETGSLALTGNGIIADGASGASSSAANVAVVPEPATLALLTLGAGAMLGRRR